jgi:hypothetical protein
MIAVFVVPVLRFSLSRLQMPLEAFNLPVTEERYWALFYMPLYTFSHNLLNVVVQIANKMGLQKRYSQEFFIYFLKLYIAYLYMGNTKYIDLLR